MVSKEDIVKTKQLGNPILNSVSKIYMKSGQVYVKKNYKTIINFLKWFGLRIFTFGSNLFVVWASHRIQNEINSKKFCKKYDIKTPKLIDQEGYNLIVELINGIPLDAVHTNEGRKNFIKAYEKMGMILAKIHNLNACIGDCKPENIFETEDNELYILDFDQFRFFRKFSEKMLTAQLWDFHEFLFYLGHFFPNSNHPLLPKLIRAFQIGYFNKRKRNKVFGKFLIKIGSPRYIWSYLLFLNPLTLKLIYHLVTTEKQRIIRSLVI
ncbi:MAG: hypothetical protein HeimC3_13530 [Candidatus Heimdallarchaeota archaeon LC_3]|nr:MAG: hypothetical protein HeimC3_13530 [Candidatus Heimdallarchaeota archaeon LC_3]